MVSTKQNETLVCKQTFMQGTMGHIMLSNAVTISEAAECNIYNKRNLSRKRRRKRGNRKKEWRGRKENAN